MKAELRFLLLLAFSFALGKAYAQTRLYRQDENLKWFSPELINKKEVFVLRRYDSSSRWDTIAVTKAFGKFSKEEILNDPELEKLKNLAETESIQGFQKLTLILKMISSQAFARYCGAAYTDSIKCPSCEYAILKDGTIYSTTNENEKGNKVDSLELSKGGNEIFWKIETEKYYGLNFYIQKEGKKNKLNSSVIIPSTTKNIKHGRFLIEENIKEGESYTIHCSTVNFFNRESSEEVTIRFTKPDVTAPPLPGNITTEKTGKQVFVKWQYYGDFTDSLTFLAVNMKTDDTLFSDLKISCRQQQGSFLVQDYGKYEVILECSDPAGNKSRTVPQFVDVYDDAAPSAPRGVSACTELTVTEISWNANPEKDINGYNIYARSTDAGFLLLNREPVLQNKYLYSWPPGIRNKLSFLVAAVDSTGNQSFKSDTVFAVFPDLNPPSETSIVNCKSYGGNIHLEWLSNKEKGTSGYEIKLIPSNGEVLFVPCKSDRTTIYNLKNLSTGHYEISVTVLDSAANRSKPCRPVHVSVSSKPAPEKISALKVRKQNHHVHISWESESPWFIIYKTKKDGSSEPCMDLFSEKKITLSINDKEVTYELRSYSKTFKIQDKKIIDFK